MNEGGRATNVHEGGARAASTRAELKKKIQRLRDAMLDGLVDRDEPVRLMLAAMLAGEHMLLLGPPGTAKSELARRLHGTVGGAYFERLLTRFSVPEELFGPLSLRELENDRYVRRVDGYLPTASVAFIDEVFKANSAILNALLTVLNERLFDNGASRERIPLVSLVGASNELPKGEELAALYDRFLVRYQVGSVTAERFAEMALAGDGEWTKPAEADRLSEADLAAVRSGASATAIPTEVADLLRSLREAAPSLGLSVSDRRWKKIVKLLRTVALVDGRDEVTRWDFWVVSHCVWTTPEQRPAVQEWYEKQLGVDASATPDRTRRVIAAVSEGLEEMKRATDPLVNKKTGKLVYRAANGEERDGDEPRQMMRGKEPLYLEPAHGGDRTNGGAGVTAAELRRRSYVDQGYLADRSNWMMEAAPTLVLRPREYSPAEIQECIAQVAPSREAVEASLRDIGQKIREVDDLLANHVLVPASFRAPALAGLRANGEILAQLRKELKALEDGFSKLPQKAPRAIP
ncbi:MAG: AAA family ATPase [Sandaracinus sp.]